MSIIQFLNGKAGSLLSRFQHGVLLLLILLTACDLGVDPGQIRISVIWEEKPPMPLWYWVRVEERDVATEPGRILASAGPDLHVPGAPLEIKLGNVDNGKNRVVIVDTRLHPDPAEPVAYYGLSEPFEIRPGLTPDEPIVIHMNPPKPGVVSPVTVEPEAFASDINWEGTFIKETGAAGARDATLRFTLVGAAAVKSG